MTIIAAIDYLKHPQSADESDLKEALETAITAMEKQIPKKPYYWGDGYSGGGLVYDMYNCPNCEESYELEYERYYHCPHCGQAIDFSGEGEE